MAYIEKTKPTTNFPRGGWKASYRGPDGKERSKTRRTKAEAETWLATEQADRSRGVYIDPAAGKITLANFADQWMARMTPTWRATTAAGITNSLEHHVLPVLGRRSVASIRKSDVEALCASLALAPSTVGIVHQHLGQLLGSAVEDGLIVRNPARRARLPKREASKAQPVPFEAVERIQAALPAWMAIAVPLGIGAGLRQGETSGLTVDRLDLLRRRMRIDRQLVTRHVPTPVLGPPKTESSHRTIPLAGFLVDALADHLRRFPAEPDELVVRSPAGLPMDADRFGNQWRRACRAACLASVTTRSGTPSPRRCSPGACQ